VLNVDVGGTVLVRGSASDNSGISRIDAQMLTAGALPSALTEPTVEIAAATQTDWSIPVTPVAGPNTFQVTVRDGVGRVVNVTRSFKVRRPLKVQLVGNGSVTSGFTPRSYRDVGSFATITATPVAGHLFTGWTVSGASLNQIGVTDAMLLQPKLSFTFREGLVLRANFAANPFMPSVAGIYNGGITPNAALPTLFRAGHRRLRHLLREEHWVLHRHAEAGWRSSAGQRYFRRERRGALWHGAQPCVDRAAEGQGCTERGAEPGCYPAAVRQHHGHDQLPRRQWAAGGHRCRPRGLQCGQPTEHRVSRPEQRGPNLHRGFPPQGERGLHARPVPTRRGAGQLEVHQDGQCQPECHTGDGTAFTASTTLSAANTWRLYAPLYKSKGVIAGSAGFNPTTTEDITAIDSFWLRPVQDTQHYAAGWPTGIRVDMKGAKHVVTPNVSVVPGLALDERVLVLVDRGNLAVDQQLEVFINSADQATELQRPGLQADDRPQVWVLQRLLHA